MWVTSHIEEWVSTARVISHDVTRVVCCRFCCETEWRQNLFLCIFNTRGVNKTPFELVTRITYKLKCVNFVLTMCHISICFQLEMYFNKIQDISWGIPFFSKCTFNVHSAQMQPPLLFFCNLLGGKFLSDFLQITVIRIHINWMNR